ncbi:MAG: hypothetical protein WC979_02530 [Candidatus Pacearchaeota archaeon]|jgi:hypothetical protein|nr:hypothetical protein [Clostridia bacterium]
MERRIPTIEEFSAKPEETNEAVGTVDLHFKAKMFCQEVLKLGTKNNLFDTYMKSHQINPDDLSDFMVAVIENIQTNYLV